MSLTSYMKHSMVLDGEAVSSLTSNIKIHLVHVPYGEDVSVTHL